MAMSKRDVVKKALEFQPVSYVPWQFTFTEEAEAKLRTVWPTGDLDEILGNHLVLLGSQIGFFEEQENDRVRDVFGVIWDRSEDKDIAWWKARCWLMRRWPRGNGRGGVREPGRRCHG